MHGDRKKAWWWKAWVQIGKIGLQYLGQSVWNKIMNCQVTFCTVELLVEEGFNKNKNMGTFWGFENI